MCGIAGASLSPGYVPSSLVQLASLAALSHRGPDDSAVYESANHGIFLAHARLSILDLSPLGRQPMVSEDGQVVLALNGEIYNYRELRAELVSKGYLFRGQSDTEVLLNLYLDVGEALLPRLNGIFAFAIWDCRFGSLLLARDGLGVKPLYYAESRTGLAFASEIKALPAPASRPQSLDHRALLRYLSYLWCPGAGTPLKAVRKLQPGEALRVRQGKIEKSWSWYCLPAVRSVPSALGFAQALSGSVDYLRQAVHRQMVADVPVGAFLSGGLDSSAIVNFAKQLNPELQCFTIQLSQQSESEGFVDDLPYARMAARHLGVSLEVVRVDSAQMAAGLEAMVWQLDEPLADPAALNLFHICQVARQQGIKVLLSGTGGDDLFSGYRRHLALENEKYWCWLPRPLRVQLHALTGHLPAIHPLTRRLRKAFSGAHLEGDARLVHYFRWIERADLQALFSPAFRAALGNVRAEDPMLEFLAGLPSNTPALERMLALEQRFFLTDHNLTYTDKMSMAMGVEVRVPFLDPDLVEFAAQIPPRFKQRGRQGKWILKKAMEPYLPKDLIYRPKSGFGAPLRRWLQVELRDWLADSLSVERLQRRGLFDPQAVQHLIAANAEGRIDASYTLLSLACIEIWCKYFLDGAPSPHLNFQVADS